MLKHKSTAELQADQGKLITRLQHISHDLEQARSEGNLVRVAQLDADFNEELETLNQVTDELFERHLEAQKALPKK